MPCLLRPLCSYMDAINRRLALAFLLEFAWRNPDRQILLLTPQDISGGCFLIRLGCTGWASGQASGQPCEPRGARLCDSISLPSAPLLLAA